MEQFGYQKVSAEEKTRRVNEVFDSVAERYDLMNDLMSLGIHRLWKRMTVELANVRPGYRILDLAGGTADLASRFSAYIGEAGRITVSDINASMLAIGRDRLTDRNQLDRVTFVQANAEALPWAENTFDLITIAFGLRNVTRKDVALAEMLRVLRPGGKVLVLEFSKPVLPGLKPLYDLYSFTLLPVLGRLIVNDAASYRYLAESIRVHPDQESLAGLMTEVGFERCEYFNMSGGIVALHRGVKL